MGPLNVTVLNVLLLITNRISEGEVADEGRDYSLLSSRRDSGKIEILRLGDSKTVFVPCFVNLSLDLSISGILLSVKCSIKWAFNCKSTYIFD